MTEITRTLEVLHQEVQIGSHFWEVVTNKGKNKFPIEGVRKEDGKVTAIIKYKVYQ